METEPASAEAGKLISDYFLNKTFSEKTTIALGAWFVVLLPVVLLLRYMRKEKLPPGKRLPPHIPSKIPYLGCAVEFNKDPLKFLQKAYEKYGDVFSFTMCGQTFTYVVGADASAMIFNTSNDHLNAEDIYGPMTNKIYGNDVAFSIPNRIWCEQKRIIKGKLNAKEYELHVPKVKSEIEEVMEVWAKEDKIDLYKNFMELIVFVSSYCLHGAEIRAELDVGMARLYEILDENFNYLQWLFPEWIPFPYKFRRNYAHREIKRIFHKVIDQRRKQPGEDNLLQHLMTGKYKNYYNGRTLTDSEVSGMCIGILHAGVHTSSCIASWLGLFLAKHKDIQDKCYEEQMEIAGETMAPVTFDQVQKMHLLHRVMQETCRLRPPLMSLMRRCRVPVTYKDMVIPVGHQVAVSPCMNGRIRDFWGEDVEEFKPDRWLTMDFKDNGKYNFSPFGNGRHRCVGEKFAFMEIKTMWAELLRKYEVSLVDGRFPDVCLTTMVHTPDEGYVKFTPRKL